MYASPQNGLGPKIAIVRCDGQRHDGLGTQVDHLEKTRGAF